MAAPARGGFPWSAGAVGAAALAEGHGSDRWQGDISARDHRGMRTGSGSAREATESVAREECFKELGLLNEEKAGGRYDNFLQICKRLAKEECSQCQQ